MIKYALICKSCKLEFESWFGSSKEFDRLKKMKLLNCQSCNSIKVEKSLMSPNLSNSKKKIYNTNELKFKEVAEELAPDPLNLDRLILNRLFHQTPDFPDKNNIN